MTTPPPPAGQPQPPQMPSGLAIVLEHAAEAVALEKVAVAALAPLRQSLEGVMRAVMASWVRIYGSLDEPGDPIGTHSIIAAIRGALAGVDPHVAHLLEGPLADAVAMGVRQAEVEVRAHTPAAYLPAPTQPPAFEVPALDPAIQAAVDAINDTVRAKLDDTERLANQLPAETSWEDTQRVVLHAQSAATAAEATAETAVNAGVNQGTTAVSDTLGGRKLWIAERDACAACLGLSGHVSDEAGLFDPTLTFGAKPLAWLPNAVEKPDGTWSGGYLNGPPRHPRCRCRTSPWLGSVPGYTGPDLPAALRREAERSILTGWRLASESNTVRIDAAKRLLARGTNLPKSVQERAEKAVARGIFGNFPRQPRPPRKKIAA